MSVVVLLVYLSVRAVTFLRIAGGEIPANRFLAVVFVFTFTTCELWLSVLSNITVKKIC